MIMSPVTRKSAEGLPVFYLRDIPPVATGGPPVREPRIYYGELTDTYVIVKGSTPEFDYPKGKDNVYAPYGGVGGVPVGSVARRALFAWYFNDPNILISSYVTAESRIMFRRNIKERVETIAPFLRLDRNPYLVVSDGRLFWVQDAYTTSNYFPYAVAYDRDAGLNYIRNSVKVIVDAYNGSVDLYLADPSDPIAATYQRIFPGLFKAFAAMPQDLQRHIRYPEDLFLIQAHTYGAYHMETPEVFYNREDLWQFPRQPADGGTAMMAPYYMIMRLPGEHGGREHPDAADGAEPAREHDRLAGSPVRSAPLRRVDRLRVPQGQARLRPVPDRGSHQSEYGDIAATLPLEPAGLAGYPREPPCDSDRELHSVRVAVVSARVDGTDPGAQARDRRLWRPSRHGGDARSGAGGSLHGACPSPRSAQERYPKVCSRPRRPIEPGRLSATTARRWSG